MIVTNGRMLGSVVRQRRQALGWSQARLAEAAGVSRPWISQFEAGKPSVEIGLVFAVIDALELQLNVTSGAAWGRQPTWTVAGTGREGSVVSSRTAISARQPGQKRSATKVDKGLTKSARPAITTGGKSIAAARARAGLKFTAGLSTFATKRKGK